MFETENTKYHPLFEHLLFSGRGQISMSFAEIASILGAPLPPSAFKRQEWWSNSPRGHSQARAWMRAGYSASRIDLEGQSVVFTLDGWPDAYGGSNVAGRQTQVGLNEPPQADLDAPQSVHPLFGLWKGKVKLLPDHDYTKPAFEPDNADNAQ